MLYASACLSSIFIRHFDNSNSTNFRRMLSQTTQSDQTRPVSAKRNLSTAGMPNIIFRTRGLDLIRPPWMACDPFTGLAGPAVGMPGSGQANQSGTGQPGSTNSPAAAAAQEGPEQSGGPKAPKVPKSSEKFRKVPKVPKNLRTFTEI